MSLSDKSIAAAKSTAKPHKLFDGGGLYIEVSPSGGKYWRLKYRLASKERRAALGVYPTISLKEARDKAIDEVRGRGVLVGLVVPGPVDTDMSRAYRAAAAQSGRPVTTPVLSPAESARTLADYVEALGPERSGRFYGYN
jgi:hypothetical protein